MLLRHFVCFKVAKFMFFYFGSMTDQGLNLRFLLEKEKLKLDGSNFGEWYRNVRIILRNEGKESYLTTPPMVEPPKTASDAEKKKYEEDDKKHLSVQCLLCYIMVPELQKRFEYHAACDIISDLKKLFQEQDRNEIFNMIKGLINTKMPEGSSVSSHIFKMQGYIQELERREVPITNIFVTDVILNSLPSSFTHFVQNYHMMKWDKSLEELQGMLKTYETDSKKHKPQAQVLAVTDKKIDKNKKKKGNKKRKDKKGKGKFSDEGSDKSKTHPDSECFYCKSKGHWKRNCRKYLQDKKSGASTSGISKVIN